MLRPLTWPPVVTLYLEMPDTPMRVSVSDQWLARHFHQDGVPLETVEAALRLGSLRRLIRPADAPRRSPIRSLAYFRPVIEELCERPAAEAIEETGNRTDRSPQGEPCAQADSGWARSDTLS